MTNETEKQTMWCDKHSGRAINHLNKEKASLVVNIMISTKGLRLIGKLIFSIFFLASFYTAFQNLEAKNTGSTLSFKKDVPFPSFTFCPLIYANLDLSNGNLSFKEHLEMLPSMKDDMILQANLANRAIYDPSPST